MVFAAAYPSGGIFWSMLIFFFWVIWIWMVVTVLMDVFRRSDIGGWSKALWVVFVIILPYLGVLIYLIVNHDGMAQRRMSEVQASQQQFNDYVRTTAASGGAAQEIEKAKGLLDNGTITQAEFEAIKTKALA